MTKIANQLPSGFNVLRTIVKETRDISNGKEIHRQYRIDNGIWITEYKYAIYPSQTGDKK
jgi:hypothetical protein